MQNTNSIAIFMPIFVGYAMTGFVYHSNVAVKSYRRHGKLWHKQDSEYLKAHDIVDTLEI